MNADKVQNMIRLRGVTGNKYKFASLDKSFTRKKSKTEDFESFNMQDIDLQFAYNSAQESIQKYIGSRSYNITPSLYDNREKIPKIHSTKYPITRNLGNSWQNTSCSDMPHDSREKKRHLPILNHIKPQKRFVLYRNDDNKQESLSIESIRKTIELRKSKIITFRKEFPSAKKQISAKDSLPWKYNSQVSGVFRLSTLESSPEIS